jgi:hypothetical protein
VLEEQATAQAAVAELLRGGAAPGASESGAAAPARMALEVQKRQKEKLDKEVVKANTKARAARDAGARERQFLRAPPPSELTTAAPPRS